MKNAIAALFMLISICFISGPACAAAPGDYLFQWGSQDYLNNPHGIATDSSGNVYVADTGNNRILKYDSSGTFIMQWGTFGGGNGQFQSPHCMAVDGSSGTVYVYVVDTYNSRIQKFDSSGNYITQWATNSSAGDYPYGVAVDGSGNVYVAAPISARIVKYDSSGTFIMQWGSAGTGNGQFNQPVAVAVHGSGSNVSVYVSDSSNNRIQEFDGSGNYIRQWGSLGSDTGQFNMPGGLAVYASSGNLYVYVTDYKNYRVQKFDGAGNYIAQWGSVGCEQSQFSAPLNVAVDGNSGSVYVLDDGQNRIQKFDSSGNYLIQWGELYNPYVSCRPGNPNPAGSGTLFGNGGLCQPDGMAVDASGNVYVADFCDNRIQIFDSSGNYISQIGGILASSNPGNFYTPRAVAVDAANNIYVADTGNNRIQKFDGSGNYITEWGWNTEWGGKAFNGVYGVAVTGGSGPVYVYVTDYGNNRILKFDSSGNLITGWGSTGTGNGQFNGPLGVALDRSNNVYVTEFSNDRVQKFDSAGNYITQWGSFGYDRLWGIAVDGSGNVYVSDDYNHRVQVFDNIGTFKGTWGSLGFGNGMFGSPTGIATNATGTIVYVADNIDNRIQAFAGYVCTLTYNAGANGTISGITPQTVSSGGSGTQVTAVANPGYHFVSWSDGVTTAARTDTNVTANINVTASFAITINTYTLTYNAGANGTISGSTPQTVNSGGSGTQVTAVANPGYHFVSWSDGVTTAARTDTNVTANINVTASFALQNQYTLNFTAGAGGAISGTTPQYVLQGGSSKSVTAVPNTGYQFVNWTGDNGFATTKTNPLTVTNVKADHNIAANFAINHYTINFAAGSHGSVTGTKKQTVSYGNSTTAVTATPATGYHFLNWTGTNGFVTTTDNPLTVTDVTASQTITANFAPNQFALNFDAGAGGTVTGTTPQTINYGGSATAVKANPDPGHHFVNWTGDNGFATTKTNPLTVKNVKTNQNITANFAINQYTLTFTAGPHGSISGTKKQTVNYGGSTTAVTATTATGYHFVNWTGTNDFVTTSDNPLIVTNVTASQTIKANFSK